MSSDLRGSVESDPHTAVIELAAARTAGTEVWCNRTKAARTARPAPSAAVGAAGNREASPLENRTPAPTGAARTARTARAARAASTRRREAAPRRDAAAPVLTRAARLAAGWARTGGAGWRLAWGLAWGRSLAERRSCPARRPRARSARPCHSPQRQPPGRDASCTMAYCDGLLSWLAVMAYYDGLL